MKYKTLEDAVKHINELEHEIERLKKENQELKSRKVGGRKKHDESWTASYNDFINKYENGESLMQIVNNGSISRRTAYRYLEYYKKLNEHKSSTENNNSH